MTTPNIELFDEYTGKIFAHLYKRFPLPASVKPSDFVECGAISLAQDEYVYTTDEAKVFIATAKWLVRTGYIHCAKEKNSYLGDAVLTAKGLEILKLIPNSIDGAPSLGDRLAKAVKEDAREVLRSTVSEVLSIGAKLISPLIGVTG